MKILDRVDLDKIPWTKVNLCYGYRLCSYLFFKLEGKTAQYRNTAFQLY